jgi:DNA-binding NarL/FixJ family response regulator
MAVFPKKKDTHTMSDSQVIRILAVDDHPLLRAGIAALIGTQADMTIVGEAASGREAIANFRSARPDITLMDLQMPDIDGIDAILAIRSEFPQARVIVLTTYEGDALAHRALKAGARAYILKSMVRKDLLNTIRSVHAGHKHIQSEIAAELADHATDDPLTEREIEVLTMIGDGNSNKMVADKLSITEHTVKGHVKSILSKLGASDRTHAVKLGLKRGITHL